MKNFLILFSLVSIMSSCSVTDDKPSTYTLVGQWEDDFENENPWNFTNNQFGVTIDVPFFGPTTTWYEYQRDQTDLSLYRYFVEEIATENEGSPPVPCTTCRNWKMTATFSNENNVVLEFKGDPFYPASADNLVYLKRR